MANASHLDGQASWLQDINSIIQLFFRQGFVFGAWFLGSFALLNLLPAMPFLALIGGCLSAYAIHVVYTCKKTNSDNPFTIYYQQLQELAHDLWHGRFYAFSVNLYAQVITIVKGLITGFAAYKTVTSGANFLGLILNFSFWPALIFSGFIFMVTYLIQTTKLIDICRQLFGLTRVSLNTRAAKPLILTWLTRLYHQAMVLGHGLGQFGPAYLVMAGILMPQFSIPTFIVCSFLSLSIGVLCGWFYGKAYWQMMTEAKTETTDAAEEITHPYVASGIAICSSVVKGILSFVGIQLFINTTLGLAGISCPPLTIFLALYVGYATAWVQGARVLPDTLKAFSRKTVPPIPADKTPTDVGKAPGYADIAIALQTTHGNETQAKPDETIAISESTSSPSGKRVWYCQQQHPQLASAPRAPFARNKEERSSLRPLYTKCGNGHSASHHQSQNNA